MTPLASQASATRALPAVAASPVGATGSAVGVALIRDDAPLPLGLTARTSKVYSVALVSPVSVWDVAFTHICVP